MPLHANKTSFKQGNTVWLGKKHSTESKQKMSEIHKRLWQNPEYRHKCETAQLGSKHTQEHIRRSLQKRLMSTLETKLQSIITQEKLPYKFVGNGEFFIERKNPDFVNINGEKKAIEVFYKRHKMQFRNQTLEEWKKSRKEIFQKYGWQLIFLDETQVNTDTVLKLLKGRVAK